MYNAKIETNAGAVIRLGYKDGVIFDISPLSGVDVTLATSQGYQQIGETVESQSARGVSRTIRGTFLGDAAETKAREMLRALPVFTTGKLIFDDRYFCNVYVQKTPYVIHSPSERKYTFSLMLYCETPYWLDVKESAYLLGGYTPAFTFPIRYDLHAFGVKNASAFTNCYNGGAVDVPFVAKFTSSAESSGIGLVNVQTLEKLKLDVTLTMGDEIVIKRENSRLVVELNGEDAFSIFDEDSNLYYIHPGDNVLRATADSGLEALQVSITYNAAETGVL